MPRLNRVRSTRLFLEQLETRLNLSAPTLLDNLSLPGASTTWDFSNGPFNAAPVVADVLGNGMDQVLVPGGDGNLYAYGYNSATGHMNPSPVVTYFMGPTNAGGQIQSTPVVVNLPSGLAVFVGSSTGYLYGFNAATGQILPGWPEHVGVATNAGGVGVYGPISAGDLDGTGVPDIVVTSFSHEVTAFHANGTVDWEFNNDDTDFSGAVIGDLNGNGQLDVVVGGDSSSSIFYSEGGRIEALSSQGKRLWVEDTPQVIWSAPVLADLKGNGQLDVVVGTGDLPSTAPHQGNLIYALDAKGNTLPGFPYVTASTNVDANTYPTPAIADLTGNGQLDIVAADAQGQVVAINGSGQNIWTATPFAGQNFYSSPIVADVTGSGQPEVVIAAAGGIQAMSGSDGSKVWSTQDNLFHYSAAAVGQLTGDGSYQLAIISNGSGSGGNLLSPANLQIYDLPATNLTPPWPQLWRNAAHDAVIRTAAFAQAEVSNIIAGAWQTPATQANLNQYVPLFQIAPSLLQPIEQIIGDPQARTILINGWYETYLGRPPEPGGLQNWLGVIASGVPYSAVEATIVGSDEAYADSGGTPTDWVSFLYQKVLGRAADPGGLSYWSGVLSSGALNREEICQGFLLSQELTQDEVSGWYKTYQPGGLGTPPADDLQAAGMDLRSGALEEHVLGNILVSNGDYVRTQGLGSYLRAAYQDILGRPPAPAETAGWLASFANGATVAQFATALMHSTEYLTTFVTSLYQNLLKRNPGPGEVNPWVSALQTGLQPEDITEGFLQSTEFYTTVSGGNLNAFVNNVFQDLLRRAPSSSELNQWLTDPNPRVDLPQVGLFGAPTEYREDQISDWYMLLLRRLPSTPADSSALIPGSAPFGGQFFLSQWAAGSNALDLEAGILASVEYQQAAHTQAFWLGNRWLDLNPLITS